MRELPILMSTEMVQAILAGRKTETRRIVKPQLNESLHLCRDFVAEYSNGVSVKCPYGQPGDVLWVREKHRKLVNCETGEFHHWSYYANMLEKFHKQYQHKWKPSIHMPKAAARIWLQVLEIKVERLQEITEEGAIADGIEKHFSSLFHEFRYKDYLNPNDEWRIPTSSFTSLWLSINGQDSWAANPWVWVVKFKVLSTTGKPSGI